MWVIEGILLADIKVSLIGDIALHIPETSEALLCLGEDSSYVDDVCE